MILSTYSKEPEGGSSAYDVALLSACRDRDWKCWSVAPELFHHGLGHSEIFRADTEDGKNTEERDERGSTRGTWNLACGARHRQLWVKETGKGMRSLVKETVRSAIQSGECPIDAVMEEESWKGCEYGEYGAQS